MPITSYWLDRLPEIAGISSLSTPALDRSSFERIFRLRRHRAIELMHQLGSYPSVCDSTALESDWSHLSVESATVSVASNTR